MIDHELGGLGRFGLGEGGPGGADGSGASQQRDRVAAVQVLDVHDVSPFEIPTATVGAVSARSNNQAP